MFINYEDRELNCKIVYCGPPLAGKSTNLKYVHERTSPETRGKLITLRNATGSTVFFDFLTVLEVRGYRVRLHLYTYRAPELDDPGRSLVLKGLDAVVFVADSQPHRMEENKSALGILQRDLEADGRPLDALLFLFQYNKRDLPKTLPIAELERALNLTGAPSFEAVASEGKGVFDTLKELSRRLVLRAGGRHA